MPQGEITSATEKGKAVISRIRSVIKTHFPELFQGFNELTDNRKRREYQMAEILTGALFMFIFKETSRNAFNTDRSDACFRKNFFRYFGLNLPHADSADDVLRVLPTEELELLKTHLVAVDGTGMASFDHKHCEHCLTKTSKTGVVTYFHYVLVPCPEKTAIDIGNIVL